MKKIIVIVFLLMIRNTSVQAEEEHMKIWNFEEDRAGEAPAGFSFAQTGDGRLGRWVVRTDKEAPRESHVLAQVDSDKVDYRFPIAIVNEPLLCDLHLSVQCKPVSGQIDRACGLVFRYQNENNYYVTRANALENNVRLYKVVNSDRQQLASWSGPISAGVWHGLRVDATGDHFEVYWDGQKVLDAHDQTFNDAGRIGVWTKADSVTYFDDLSAEPQ